MFAVDLEKEGGFLGKEAIVAQREALASGGGAGGGAPHPSMPSERLVNLKVDMDGGVPIVEYGGSPSPESSSTIPMLWGGEVRREVCGVLMWWCVSSAAVWWEELETLLSREVVIGILQTSGTDEVSRLSTGTLFSSLASATRRVFCMTASWWGSRKARPWGTVWEREWRWDTSNIRMCLRRGGWRRRRGDSRCRWAVCGCRQRPL